MPRVDRVYKRGAVTQVDKLDRFFLETGAESTLGRYREAWHRHGRMILREWIERYPGTRPAGWWRFEAPEPRRAIIPGMEPLQGRGQIIALNRDSGEVEYAHETECNYLRRLGLLTPGEDAARKAMSMDDDDDFDRDQ
jgi:hypothetical protein